MCDLSPIYAALTVAEIAMLAAIISCGIAIAMNLGFFSAAGAPVAGGIALAAALVAALALAGATSMLASCGAQPPCDALQRDAVVALGGLTGILAAGIAIAYIAALTAAVPFAGTGPMAVELCFLALASGLMPAVVGALTKLEACTPAPPASFSEPAHALAVVVAFVGVVTLVLMLLLAGRSNKEPGPRDGSSQ